MLKIKHQRTADCVVAGFRWHKNGPGTHIGSLLLGLFDDDGKLHHVGVTSSFSWDRRAALVPRSSSRYRENALDGHPWGEWAEWARGARVESGQRLPGATIALEPRQGPVVGAAPRRASSPRSPTTTSRAIASGTATTFKRWRPDKPPADCRYDQLEETAAYEIAKIFGG